MKKIAENKIKKNLKGIDAIQTKINTTNIVTGLVQPNAFYISAVLFGFMECENFGKMDKVEWHTYIKYKDKIFMIRDYKFGSWSIECEEISEETNQIASELKIKLSNAAKYIVKYDKTLIKDPSQVDGFYNNYNFLRYLYEHYDELYLHETVHLIPYKSSGKFNMIEKVRETNEKIIIGCDYTILLFPLLQSFFSLIELLLYIFNCFTEDEQKTGNFLNLRFGDKIGVIKKHYRDKKLSKYLESIYEIKKLFRDPLIHGMLSLETRLVSRLMYGLLHPKSNLDNELFYRGWGSIECKRASDIRMTFRRFIDYIENTEPYFYCVLFAERLPTISLEAVLMTKPYMTSKDDYIDNLNYLNLLIDEIVNRD